MIDNAPGILGVLLAGSIARLFGKPSIEAERRGSRPTVIVRALSRSNFVASGTRDRRRDCFPAERGISLLAMTVNQ